MIIDMHTHIGEALNFNMPPEMLLESMNKYGIDFALISNIEAGEADHNQRVLPSNLQVSQADANRKSIEFARKHTGRIGVLLWGKPLTEGCNENFERLIKEYRDVIYGIKIHPYHGALAFDDERTIKYVKLADQYNLPILTHTATDKMSSPQLVYNVAKQFPKVNFIMGHMGLGSDNREASELISRLPNLYGDTAWVKPANAIDMIRMCGVEKLMFGTDSPIDGIDTYANKDIYRDYFDGLNGEITKEEYDKLMYKNAIRIFGLKLC